ncbi:DNA mismatch repair protein MutS [Halolactibacillus miurensis]|uniref:DNA mismatch repair protein MutS n=1 Tax=Halolactibacillus miurensis TaxID=306541 RepID=A0A1I6QHM6_9BACI|nr:MULTISPECIES: DNA mismatch repair protein MutS [Halolactibacillus]GEM03362.1 DNA mismatch repair protein MutS [Halolactibacillus miurensis]SFS51924.1 DNA mismatch repair protein MutS [Halolactibacillus miurensis]
MPSYTPMIQQYLKIKARYNDCFLFFRLGDFYEMFFDDATKAAQELEITLTSRDGGAEERIPMCGIPYHASTNYIKTLVERGYKVAICEQVEDPKTAKGVVKRDVVQVITPGTVMEGAMLLENENNYLASVDKAEGDYMLSFIDLSTGELYVLSVNHFDRLKSEIYNRPIKEVVVSDQLTDKERMTLSDELQLTISHHQLPETIDRASYGDLLVNISHQSLRQAIIRLIHYISTTQQRSLDHVQPAEEIVLSGYLGLDMHSKRNLELTETMMKKGKQGSLLWVLDQTVTAMGGRYLKKWLERPLLDRQALSERYAMVEGLLDQFIERESLRDDLKSIYDLERLSGRVAFGNINPRDLQQLTLSLSRVPTVKETLKTFHSPYLQAIGEALDPLSDLRGLLEQSLADEPPMTLKEGGIIKDGFHAQLDDYRDASRNGKQWINALEQKEREETKIKSLKIGYNRVFGYYIEVTKANLHLLPEGKYERKQTLTNAERYITPELKEKENLILQAEEKSLELELQLFNELREQVKAYIPRLQQLAEKVSTLDVLQSFAVVSEQEGYVKPTLIKEDILEIVGGRHPVVEKVMTDGMYVPNDIKLNSETNMLLITGPNMSGKSTYMRQIALTVIMAQIGCFVPAESATLPIFDQIFTRIGAADDLVSGQSTFMVEMLESKHALEFATNNSLILLDEIGRGTSTYDGMALAQAIIEYVHDHIGAKTLFSTHYHELTSLSETLTQLENVHVSAEEHDGEVVFLHKIKPGPADESYGIHVAKLAGLPGTLINRANVILQLLESNESEQTTNNVKEKTAAFELASQKVDEEDVKNNAEMTILQTDDQLSFFAETTSTSKNKKGSRVEKKLKQLDLMSMTPIDAMNALFDLKKELQKEE